MDEYFQVLKSSMARSKTIDEKLGDWDLVTQYDRMIEDIIVGRLKREFPNHRFVERQKVQLNTNQVKINFCVFTFINADRFSSFGRFIGEESTGKNLPELTNDPTWIIDPIDGTMNFIHGFPHTCVVIGLSINKEMRIGIVYNPILEQMFTARKGRGAFLNGRPITTSKVQGSLMKEQKNFIVSTFL